MQALVWRSVSALVWESVSALAFEWTIAQGKAALEASRLLRAKAPVQSRPRGGDMSAGTGVGVGSDPPQAASSKIPSGIAKGRHSLVRMNRIVALPIGVSLAWCPFAAFLLGAIPSYAAKRTVVPCFRCSSTLLEVSPSMLPFANSS